MTFYKVLSPFTILLYSVAVSFILRITLLFHPITDTTFIWTDEIKIFIFGLFSDVFYTILLATGILWLYNFHIKQEIPLNLQLHYFWVFVALFLYIASKSY
jgi:hypothetical protein